MKEAVFDGIVQKVRTTVSADRNIAVIGWAESHHTMPTRKMAARVRFFEKPPEKIDGCGLVVVLKPLEPRDFRRFNGKECEVVSSGLTISQIKGVLHRCEKNLICPNPPVAASGHEPAPATENDIDKLAAQISTTMEGVEVSNLEKFCKAFAEKAKEGGGFVGKMVLGELLKEHGVEETVLQLVKKEFLLPIVSEGRARAGRYKIGPAMEKVIVAEKLEPTDPIDRARYLIEGEEGFEAELARLEAARQAERDRIAAELAKIEKDHEGPIEAIKSKLARVAKAKALMAQLGEV